MLSSYAVINIFFFHLLIIAQQWQLQNVFVGVSVGGGNAVGKTAVRSVLKQCLHSGLNKVKKYLFSIENDWERLQMGLTPLSTVGHTGISK